MSRLEALLAEVVEEPLSATLVPMALPDGKVLLGTALRTQRIAVFDIKIYTLSVYGSPEEFWDGELTESSTSSEELLSNLLASPADKLFGLTFLRSVTGKQVRDSLAEVLCKTGKVPQEEVGLLLHHVPSKVERGTELQLLVRPRQGDVGFSLGSGMELLYGKEKLCHGIHEIYFGRQSVVQGLGEALQRQRLLLASRGLLRSTLSLDEINGEIDDDAPDSSTMAVPSMESEGGSTGSFSWKQSSGRTRGRDGYKFGDLGRTLIRKMKRDRGNSESVLDDMWPAALLAEGERARWVEVRDNDRLDAAALAVQSLRGTFFKHHASAVRGRLVPQWSPRHYELTAGDLRYRRRLGGKIYGTDSLDGAHVVTESPKLSQRGAHFVFRVMKGDELVCRLSCPQQQVAQEWVMAIAGTCAYFRALRVPGERPQLQVVAQSLEDIKEEEEQRQLDAEGARDAIPMAQPAYDTLLVQEPESRQLPDTGYPAKVNLHQLRSCPQHFRPCLQRLGYCLQQMAPHLYFAFLLVVAAIYYGTAPQKWFGHMQKTWPTPS